MYVYILFIICSAGMLIQHAIKVACDQRINFKDTLSQAYHWTKRHAGQPEELVSKVCPKFEGTFVICTGIMYCQNCCA